MLFPVLVPTQVLETELVDPLDDQGKGIVLTLLTPPCPTSLSRTHSTPFNPTSRRGVGVGTRSRGGPRRVEM